ncbi:hypothetical protein PVK06_038992 [Gossypium arboreum]|uniref:Uncharacterized protein n=1 Tax=Gossypium arboreum TaxID=29729 RepID=A0ABR0N2A9_GOSAR|nr:hypothetical protein PVK06_038992 [Gossypium arboreum]
MTSSSSELALLLLSLSFMLLGVAASQSNNTRGMSACTFHFRAFLSGYPFSTPLAAGGYSGSFGLHYDF